MRDTLFFVSFFVMGVSLLTPIFTKNVLAEDGDGFSFGSEPYLEFFIDEENLMGSNYFKIIDVEYFKDYFRNNTDWVLEYKRFSYSDWTVGNNYLDIERSWNESGFWKFNLVFDVPVDVYSARFTFGVNRSLVDYFEKLDDYCYLLNFSVENDTYYCEFNWSDMVSIPNLVYTHGILDDMFWFRFRRYDIPAGHYEFDPAFGFTSSASGGPNSMQGCFRACKGMPSSSGTLDTLFVYVNSWDSGEYLNLALYWANNNTYYTDMIASNSGGSGWCGFTPDGTVNIVEDECYYIGGLSNGVVNVYYHPDNEASCVGGRYDEIMSYPGWESSISWDDSNIYYSYCFYGVYTEDTAEWNNLISNVDFSFGNVTAQHGLISNVDFSFGNVTAQHGLFSNVDFSFGNVTAQHGLFSNVDFSFGNVTAQHGLISNVDFSFGNETGEINLITNVDFGFGNDSILSWNNLITNVDFGFGNDTGTGNGTVNYTIIRNIIREELNTYDGLKEGDNLEFGVSIFLTLIWLAVAYLIVRSKDLFSCILGGVAMVALSLYMYHEVSDFAVFEFLAVSIIVSAIGFLKPWFVNDKKGLGR